ncbi:MAG: glycosyltransferase involved in cell wall biosynthesis [Akkermansiaceae bacterium]|jgi:glycosyltransferase involved in cell wall biosynthesis
MAAAHTLVLIDYHPLVPFIVRSHQFVSRAAAFAAHAPADLDVQIWLPSPELSVEKLTSQIGLKIPDTLASFGPPRARALLGKNITLTFLFRNWIKKQLTLLAKTTRPIAYFRTLKLAAALAPHLKALGIPYIFETHEIFSKTAGNPEKVLPLETSVYQNASLVIPISKSLADDLVTDFNLDCPILMPSGHNNSLADISAYDPAAPSRFLYIGSLHRWKGLEPFLLATKDLKVPTDIVGDAGGLDRLQEFVGANHLKHVVLHGQKAPEDLKSFYGKGTLCVLPLSEAQIAQRYTSPLKLFEYTSAGRPVMIGSAPSITTIPGASEAVCLVDGNWKEAATKLSQDPTERARLAKAAKEFSSHYTWPKIAKNLLEAPAFHDLKFHGSS